MINSLPQRRGTRVLFLLRRGWTVRRERPTSRGKRQERACLPCLRVGKPFDLIVASDTRSDHTPKVYRRSMPGKDWQRLCAQPSDRVEIGSGFHCFENSVKPVNVGQRLERRQQL